MKQPQESHQAHRPLRSHSSILSYEHSLSLGDIQILGDILKDTRPLELELLMELQKELKQGLEKTSKNRAHLRTEQARRWQ